MDDGEVAVRSYVQYELVEHATAYTATTRVEQWVNTQEK